MKYYVCSICGEHYKTKLGKEHCYKQCLEEEEFKSNLEDFKKGNLNIVLPIYFVLDEKNKIVIDEESIKNCFDDKI